MANRKPCLPSRLLVLLNIFAFLSCSLAIQLCDGPSDAEYTGSNIDGSGVYINSDRVTHPYKFPAVRRCWYDYFVTNASLYFGNWTKSSPEITCATTYTCTLTSSASSQSCQSRSDEISIGIGYDIGETKNGQTEGTRWDLGYTLTLTTENCDSSFNLTSCQWNDMRCHTVFTSQQYVKHVGYRRQRCNWGNGDETMCLDDLVTDTPTSTTNYQCGGECGTDPDVLILYNTTTSSLTPSTTTQSASTTTQSASTTTQSASTTTQVSISTVTFTPTTSSITSTSATIASASAISSVAATASAVTISEKANTGSTFGTGAKIGVGFGTIAAVALFFILGIWALKQRRKVDAYDTDHDDANDNASYATAPPAYGVRHVGAIPKERHDR